MKKLTFCILIFLCYCLCVGSENSTPSFNKPLTKEDLCRFLPDSVCSLLDKSPIIFYSYGHYGYSWSLLVKKNNNVRAYSGKVSPLGKSSLTEQNVNNIFDSTALFRSNQELIDWGLDSISLVASKMKAVMSKYGTTVYSDLDVYNSDGICTFTSDNAVLFSGPDSLIFNKKLQKLKLLMRWLSDPKIRQYIPASTFNR